MLEKLYKYLTMIYFDFIRDTIIAFSRCFSRGDKALILDMDWYRWCLDETEIMQNLYASPVLSGHADFLRVERAQIFKDGSPFKGVSRDNYKEVFHDGFNLWGICKATIISNLGKIKINLDDPMHLKEVERVYGEAAQGIEKIKKLFSKLKPDAVFVCQGGVFDSRCIIEVARRFGIRVVGVENSMIGGLVILDDLSGLILNRHSFASTGAEFLETNQVTEEDREKVFNLWKKKLSEKSDEHKTGGIDDPKEIRKTLDIPEDRKILLLLAQVRTDASVVLDSTIYEDPVDMIEKVAKHVEKLDDTVLVVRLHPKEFLGKSPNGTSYDRMTYTCLKEKGIENLANVRVVEDVKVSTYTLMEMADAGITINSQAGLEMCMLGKPVMVCGNAFYGGKGFTLDVGNPVALEVSIDHLMQNAVMSPQQKKDALNFFYFFYKRHLFDHKLSLHPERLKELFLYKKIQAD